MVGFCYVDDCDLIQIGTSPIEVLTSMQNLIHSWRDLMKVTGATIATDKSWWYLVDYVWQKGKWVTIDPCDNLDLIAFNDDNTPISLR